MSIRTSVATNYALSIAGTLVFVAVSMVIIRILTPTEIGIFAISQAVSVLLLSIQQLGINHYIVRESTMSPEKLGSSALLLGAQGLLLCLVLLAISPLVARFQAIPALAPIVQVLALTMLLWPVETFAMAVLSRELRFATIAGALLLRTAVSAGAGVYAALHGYGALGLAYAALLAIAASAAFLLAQAWPHVRLRWTFAHWREPFRFGIVNMLLVLTRMGSLRGLEFLMGRLLGASAVGYYSRGSALIEMAQNQLFFPLTRVFLPTLSKAKQESQSSYVWSILRFNRAMLGIYHPFLALLAIFAGPVIAFLFGPQWEASRPLLSILCIAQMLTYASRGVDEVAIVEDRRRELIIVDAVRMVLLLGSLFAVYPFGLVYVAGLKVADSLIGMVCYVAILNRLAGIPVGQIVRNNLHAGLVAVGASLPGLVYMQLHDWPYRVPFGELVLLGIASLAAWLVSLWLTRHELWSEAERALSLAAARLGIGRSGG